MEVIAKGMEAGHQTPVCQAKYSVNPIEAYLSSFVADQPFSFVSGKVASYNKGSRSHILLHNGTEDLQTSLSEALGKSISAPDETYEFTDVAHHWMLVFFLPTMNSIVFHEFIVESTLTGSLSASVKRDVNLLDEEGPTTKIVLALAGILAIVLILMDIRRILRRPKFLTFESEEDRTRCSIWSLLLWLLPALLYAEMSLLVTMDASNQSVLDALAAQGQEALATLDTALRMRTTVHSLMTATVSLFGILLLRYLLLHIPTFQTLAQIVNGMKPTFFMILGFCLVALFCIAVIMKTIYGEVMDDFKDFENTAITIILYAMGNFKNWEQLYAFEPTVWTLTMLLLFFVINLGLNSLPIAVMLSFKKEGDLQENYSYHPFWSAERSRSRDVASSSSFNPATIGWDYTGKDGPQPVIPEEQRMSS